MLFEGNGGRVLRLVVLCIATSIPTTVQLP